MTSISMKTLAATALGGMLLALSASTVRGQDGDAAAAKSTPAQVREKAKAAKGGATAFYRDLKNKPFATVEDAYRVACIIVNDPGGQKGDFEGCRECCLREGFISDSWDYAPESKVTKGMVASIIARALKIRGGLTMMIVGATQRYALRECVNLKIIQDGPKMKYVTGDELLAILSRSLTYKKEAAGAGEKKAE